MKVVNYMSGPQNRNVRIEGNKENKNYCTIWIDLKTI